MKSAKLILLTLTSMMLINCGGSGSNSDKALSTNGQAKRGIPLVEAKSAEEAELLDPTGILKGRIYIDDRWSGENQSLFQGHMNSFLSPQLKVNQIGTVSGVETPSDTGVTFWGRGFQLKNGGAFDPAVRLPTGSDLLDVSTAELRINIFQKINGAIEEIPLHFNSMNAQLNNGNKTLEGQLVDSYVEVQPNGQKLVQLIFADSLGKVVITGLIFRGVNYPDGKSRFEGRITFQNLKKAGSDAPVSHQEELLGRFVVQTCGFFKCSGQ